MKYYFLSFLALVLSSSAFSQITLVDTPHCINHVLHAEVTGGIIPTSSGIVVDDGWSGVIPIGFTYNFYGLPNTQCIVGSNGCLGFNIGSAGAYNTWPISTTLAATTSTDIRNVICGPWCDVYIPAGGTIEYSQQGTAPNRNFAVTWCGTHMFGCTAEWLTTQIIIYETTGIAEVHIGHRTICASGWNGSRAIVGVKNSAGTISTSPATRDFAPTWTATNEAWRFTPSGPTYTVGLIPYSPIPYAASAIYWYDSTTGTYLGSGPDLTVVPTVPTTYVACALGCNDTTKAYIHVLPSSVPTGGIPHINNVISADPTFCGACDGSIALYGLNPTQIDSVFYSINGTPQATFVTSPLIDSTIRFTGLCAGVYDYFYVKIGECPSNTVGPVTLTNPPLTISNITSVNPDVCGKCNGVVKLYGLHPGQMDTVNYDMGGVPQPAVYQMIGLDSIFTVTGLCAGTYDNFVAKTAGVCVSNPVGPVTLTTPPLVVAYDYKIHLGCNGDLVEFRNLSTPVGSEYVTTWSFGDGTADGTTTNAAHTFANPAYNNIYHDTLKYSTVYGCQSSVYFDIDLRHPIDANFTMDASAVCLNTPNKFYGTTINLNQPSYNWNFADGRATVNHPANGTNRANDTVDYESPVAGFFTATLTVTDTIGCQAFHSDTFDVISLDIHTSVHDTAVCLPDSMAMWALPLDARKVITPSYIPFVYDWAATNNIGNTTTNNTKFMGIGTFVYTVTVTSPPLLLNPLGCTASDTERIVSYPPVQLTNVTANPVTIAYGSSIQLNAGGATFYYWTPNNGTLDNNNINNPVATPKDATTIYTVYGRSQYGCLDSAFVVVNVDHGMDDILPSGFTPNNDGLNDVFKLSNFKFQKLIQFSVYNRWGTEIFSTIDPAKGWDGTYMGVPQDIGVYNYQVIVGHPDGGNKTYKGTVTLIR